VKTNGKHETVARIARRGAVIIGLLGMTMICATADRAQSTLSAAPATAVKSSQAPVGAATVSAAVAKPTASPANSSVSSGEETPAKGAQEGIKVHGHWTIEVRKPDGAVDKHVEFENGLCLSTGGGGTIAGNSGFSGGDFAIATLLTNVSVPGGWEIFLGSPTIPSGSSPGPACNFAPVFTLLQNNASVNNGCQSPCFASLSAPTLNNNGGGNVITLTGQFTVPSNSGNVQITAVGTAIGLCSSSNNTNFNTGATCVANETIIPQLTSVSFTGTYLTGVSPIPPAIILSANQSVSVTVRISFQ
jgi:hypothetical protein